MLDCSQADRRDSHYNLQRERALPAKQNGADGVGVAWAEFSAGHRSLLERFGRETAAVWQDVSAGLAASREAYERVQDRVPEPDRIDSLRQCFGDAASALLLHPLHARLKNRPLQRALAAMADLETSLDDLVRRLPADVEMSLGDLERVVGGEETANWVQWQARLRRTRRRLPLRQLVRDQLRGETARRSRLDGEFQLLCAQASLHMLGPWHSYRQSVLDWLEYPAGEAGNPHKHRDRWQRISRRYARRATRLLARYSTWRREAPGNIVEDLLRDPEPRPARDAEGEAARLTGYAAYWSRQQRAIDGVLGLEIQLARALNQSIERLDAAAAAVDQEHADLNAELAAVIEWLEAHRDSELVAEFPSAQARLQSAETRLDDLVREIQGLAQSALPAAIETIAPNRALPSWRRPWRNIEPEAVLVRALEGVGRRTATSGFLDAESAHRAVVREIERAREVVMFARGADTRDGGEGLAAEGIANAIELLRHQAGIVAPVRKVVESSLTRALSGAALECYIALDQGRLGVLRHLAMQASEHGTHRLLHAGVTWARRAAIETGRQFRRLLNWTLFRLGLKTPPTPPAPAVFRTHRLEEALEFQLVRLELPSLYRRLFRLDPVEDPRFLVGREEEMAGLVEARCLWMTGKPVSVLVVGARGSGKTSLLNCALQVAFEGTEVVRAQFQDRIVTAEGMEQYLRNLIDTPCETTLAEHLAEGQRVVILEEVERTYLRRPGGFEAIRYLLDLVRATSASTLWVLSLNEAAARYLDRAVRMNEYFTHRINAMAVLLEDLRDAIQLRHNLSGYRLLFEPPPQKDPRISGLRRRLGLERDAEDLFFEALYEASEGVFRAGFELWQRQIDRVEGGAVHMRQPAETRFTPLLASLTQDDHLTLRAILEHGGLNVENLAAVFGETEQNGRNRMERLLAMEVLEPDPVAPGYRVRPEAGRMVREALHRQNL